MIDEASKALTEFKREYKNVTGSGGKLRSTSAKPFAFEDINEDNVYDSDFMNEKVNGSHDLMQLGQGSPIVNEDLGLEVLCANHLQRASQGSNEECCHLSFFLLAH